MLNTRKADNIPQKPEFIVQVWYIVQYSNVSIIIIIGDVTPQIKIFPGEYVIVK